MPIPCVPRLVFNRPNKQRSVLCSPAAVNLGNGFKFNRVPEGVYRSPCASIYSTWSGFKSAAFQRIFQYTLLGPNRLGTVNPLLAPFLVDAAEPRTTAQMRSPSANAWDKHLSINTPQPSLRTKPSASASNVLQRPSGGHHSPIWQNR